MLDGLFSRRKRKSPLESLFGSYVPHDAVGAMEALPAAVTRPIEFIFFATRADDPDMAADALALVVELLHQGRWMILSIMGPLVMAARGTPVDQPGAADRQALADSVVAKLGQRAKLIHGQRLARVGDLGSAGRRSYGVLIQDQLDLLAALHQSPWGAAVAPDRASNPAVSPCPICQYRCRWPPETRLG